MPSCGVGGAGHHRMGIVPDPSSEPECTNDRKMEHRPTGQIATCRGVARKENPPADESKRAPED